jgi:hypothetical protein
MKKNSSLVLFIGIIAILLLGHSIWKETHKPTTVTIVHTYSHLVKMPPAEMTLSNIFAVLQLDYYNYERISRNFIVTNAVREASPDSVVEMVLSVTHTLPPETGYRVATIREVLAFSWNHSEEFETNSVVALGTVRTVSNSVERSTYPILQQNRNAYFGAVSAYDGTWPRSYRFAFVKER